MRLYKSRKTIKNYAPENDSDLVQSAVLIFPHLLLVQLTSISSMVDGGRHGVTSCTDDRAIIKMERYALTDEKRCTDCDLYVFPHVY